jgi:hypothetical protein
MFYAGREDRPKVHMPDWDENVIDCLSESCCRDMDVEELFV